MKRLIIGSILLISITICVGMYYKKTYSYVDFSDKEVLDNARVFAYFSEDEFVIQQVEEDVDNNIYVVDPDTGEIIETVVVENSENDTVILPADEIIREELSASQIVVIGKRVSDIENVTGKSMQSIEIIEVKKGNKSLEGKKIEAYAHRGVSNYMEVRVTCESNLLLEGKEYLIFLNKTKHDDLYEIQNYNGVGYFPLEEMKREVIEDWDDVKYKDVKDYEFFVQDEVSLERLLSIREEMMDEYINE